VHITEEGLAVVRGRQEERMVRLTELTERLTPRERDRIQAALPALTRLVELHRTSGEE
jgi:hypothetical protein